MGRRLLAALALLLLVRAPAKWGPTLVCWEKGPPQQHTLRAGGETAAQALMRFFWLCCAKWLAPQRLALQVAPLALRPCGTDHVPISR